MFVIRSSRNNDELIKLKKYFDINIFIMQIEKNISDYLNKAAETKQEEEATDILKGYKDRSTSGDHESRKVIKQYIRTKILKGFNLYEISSDNRITDTIIYEDIKLEEDSGYIDTIIPFNMPNKLTAQEKFEILLYKNSFLSDNGMDAAFKNIINKYPIYHKKIKTEDYESHDYVYSEKDVAEMYRKENISLTFAEKIDILIQRLYQDIYGLKVIDLFAYSDINETGFSYDGKLIYVWSDLKFRLSFLHLTEDEARIVQERAISFDKHVGQLNESQPEILCHRADGARITVTQKPYFSARNCCIRIFNQSHRSYGELVSDDKMKILTTCLVKIGECMILQGGLGTGKSTFLSTLFEVLERYHHIGLAEEMFEQHIMEKYPEQRIVEAQPAMGKTLDDVVATFLRMSIDIAGLGEARTGEAIYAFLQLVQSVSIAAWFTAHVNSPKNTIPRLKNMLMGVGRYMSEQSAVADLVNNINCIYQHDKFGDRRLITEVVEIVPLISTSMEDDINLSISGDMEKLQKMYYIQQIQRDTSKMYKLNKIMDATDGTVKFVGYPSQRMVDKTKKYPDTWSYMDKLLKEIEKDLGKPHNLKLWWSDNEKKA